MTVFVMIRHGQSQANLDFRFAGQSDSPLTEQGIQQAERLAEWVTGQYCIDRIYSSDLCRAYQTAVPVARRMGLDIIKDESFREIFAGRWQGQAYELIKETYGDDYACWLSDIGRARCTEGESVRELAERVTLRMKELGEKESGKTILISTHATPIRAFQTVCQRGDVSFAKDIPWTANASVSVCVYEKGIFSFDLIGYNDYLDDLKSKFPSGIV